jgi:hypothetical protein
VGLPDAFQGFAVLEDQSRVKIIIGRGQQSLGEQFVDALAAPGITLAQLPVFRGILGRMVAAVCLVGLKHFA